MNKSRRRGREKQQQRQRQQQLLELRGLERAKICRKVERGEWDRESAREEKTSEGSVKKAATQMIQRREWGESGEKGV